ncbi:MAG: hypothetical protein H6991_02200 [Pseudomonadales bacterium]|nr:hypothetical protein [Pseudomonadales bacterium]
MRKLLLFFVLYYSASVWAWNPFKADEPVGLKSCAVYWDGWSFHPMSDEDKEALRGKGFAFYEVRYEATGATYNIGVHSSVTKSTSEEEAKVRVYELLNSHKYLVESMCGIYK